ncbi:MAG: GNAT family N-acetyltransferase [Polyangiaceae bacterium]
MTLQSERTIWLHDRARIFSALRTDPALHLYALGDLDDFFFSHTCWYALEIDGEPREIALLYTGVTTPALHLLATDVPAMRRLVRAMHPVLPRRFEVHATPGVSEELTAAYDLRSHGLHLKMALVHPDRAEGADATGAEPLGPEHLAELQALYAAAYPGNWFDPRMLETHRYVGVREGGRLVSVAGVHVYSAEYRIAALGNVTTLPSARGKGHAARATAALCQKLLDDCDVIGLNVLADNATAIRLYERLGFEVVASYDEATATLKPGQIG